MLSFLSVAWTLDSELYKHRGQLGPVLVCTPPGVLKDSGPGGVTGRTMWVFAFCLLFAPFCSLLHFQRIVKLQCGMWHNVPCAPLGKVVQYVAFDTTPILRDVHKNASKFSVSP